MGSQLKIKRGEKPEFEIAVGGTSALSEIAVCRYDGADWSEPFKKAVGETDRWADRWQDDDFSGSGSGDNYDYNQEGQPPYRSEYWMPDCGVSIRLVGLE